MHSIQTNEYEMRMLKAQLQKQRAEAKADEIRKLKARLIINSELLIERKSMPLTTDV